MYQGIDGRSLRLPYMVHSRAFRPHDRSWNHGRRQKLGLLLGAMQPLQLPAPWPAMWSVWWSDKMRREAVDFCPRGGHQGSGECRWGDSPLEEPSKMLGLVFHSWNHLRKDMSVVVGPQFGCSHQPCNCVFNTDFPGSFKSVLGICLFDLLSASLPSSLKPLSWGRGLLR